MDVIKLAGRDLTFNRTSMESKQKQMRHRLLFSMTFNRTSMESKQSMQPCNGHRLPAF